MSERLSSHEKLLQSVKEDERICLWCLKKLDEKPSLEYILFGQNLLCLDCSEKLVPQKRRIKIGKKKVLVLYENNEGFQNLWNQYAGLKDVRLAEVILHPWPDLIKKMKKKQPAVQSREMAALLSCWDIPVHKVTSAGGDVFVGLNEQSLLKLGHPQKYKKIILLCASKSSNGWIDRIIKRIQERIFEKIRQF